MKRRSRVHIMHDVLRTASEGGVPKTRVMYGAFLSYAQVEEYLRFMLDRGLMVYEEDTRTYKTTADGIKLLRFTDETETLVGAETEGS
jgi:predicted transcriptional regulator